MDMIEVEKEIAKATQQLEAELAKEREKVKLANDVLASERGIYADRLAAAQATIAEMREADLKIVGRNLTEEMALAAARLFDKANGRRVGAETFWRVLFDAAPPLAIPTNLDVLHEALARECERLADWRVQNRCTYTEKESAAWLREEAAAHRARKEGK